MSGWCHSLFTLDYVERPRSLLESRLLSNHMYEYLKGLKKTVPRFLKHIESGKLEGNSFQTRTGRAQQVTTSGTDSLDIDIT